MNNYVDFLHEINYFISGDNKYYNFKSFTQNVNGKLFIVGLSGSGKTTIGKDLAKKFNSEYIKLDLVDRKFRTETAERLDKPKWDKRVNSLTLSYMHDFINDIMNKNGRYVLEGIHILYQDHKFFRDKALIILGTSLLISSIRAYNRNVEMYHKKYEQATRKNILKQLYIDQSDILKKLKDFEKVMEGK